MMIDFETMKEEAIKGEKVLIEYYDCLGWKDFGDKGNSCWKPYKDSDQEREEEALWLAAVKSTMKKGSKEYKALTDLVAKEVGCDWVTYDWLCKAISRIFCGKSMDDLLCLCRATRIYRIMKGFA